MARRVKNPKRDPERTLVAARIVTGSVTDESIKPRGRPAHDRKKEKAHAHQQEASEGEGAADVSTVSRAGNRVPR